MYKKILIGNIHTHNIGSGQLLLFKSLECRLRKKLLFHVLTYIKEILLNHSENIAEILNVSL